MRRTTLQEMASELIIAHRERARGTPCAGHALGLVDGAAFTEAWGLAIYEPSGDLLVANDAFEARIGAPTIPSGDRGGAWQAFDGDGREAGPAAYPCRRALAGEIVQAPVTLVYRRDRHRTQLLGCTAIPLRRSSGHILGVALLFADHWAEAFVGDAYPLERFAEGSAKMIWTADAQSGRFEYRNLSHRCSMAAVEPATTIEEWLPAVHEADRDALRSLHAGARAGRQGHADYRLIDPVSARTRWMRDACFPIRDAKGIVTAIGGIADDIGPSTGVVYVVGENEALLARMDRICGSIGHRLVRFASLSDLQVVGRCLMPGCVFVDASSPAADGGYGLPLPVVATGPAAASADDVVNAVRAGAADYIRLPCPDSVIVDALGRIERLLPKETGPAGSAPPARATSLSKRELDVLTGLRSGGTNKSIARNLGISHRTVELHRARLMDRLNASSLAELLTIVS